ncbi:MAG: beta-lactamase family protein [Pseudomonadales bacterium]|nr:beta-lactamase family protein [Pseudomonadales bacterium]
MLKHRFTDRLAALSLTLATFTASAVAQDNSLEQDVDDILSAWNTTASPGAAVAYVENGETVFKKAYGLANLEHRIAWTTDTVSDLGSVSKQFTGFALALLAEQGKLSLDDDIRQHLPNLPDLGETITIKNLFHHTSGLREIYNTLYMVNRKPGDIIFQEDAQTLVQYQTKLQFEPGSQYLYNNTEYMLLADIVESVSGQQFHEWMDENIFAPLDMNDTVIMHRQRQVIPRVATSYVKDLEGVFTQRYDNSTLQGGGGIYSTVEDMTRWIANFTNHTVGTERTFKTLTESGVLNNGESLDYGLGISVDMIGDVERWSHGGSSAGYRSMLVYLPEYERGYIFQTSTPSNGVPAAKLSQAFLGDVLPVPDTELNPDRPQLPEAVALENPAIYQGRYLSDELEAFYSINLEGDTLSLFHRWLGEFDLRYTGEDTFLLLGRGGSLTFSRDSENDVNGFVFDNGRTIGVEFRRIEQ